MEKKTILVVEDDSAIRRGLVDALQFAGYTVIHAATGVDGMRSARTASFDLLMLDLILPGPSGFEILAAAREIRPTLPIIVLTARGEEADKVKGLRMGADDYVVKPFSVRELLARVEAVLRRSPERPNPIEHIAFPGGVADFPRSEIRFDDGDRQDLSEKETELMRYLAVHSGRAISRDEILMRIWRLSPSRMETRTIDMHIANLREKLRDTAESQRVILTVRGKGYMLAQPPVSPAS